MFKKLTFTLPEWGCFGKVLIFDNRFYDNERCLDLFFIIYLENKLDG